MALPLTAIVSRKYKLAPKPFENAILSCVVRGGEKRLRPIARGSWPAMIDPRSAAQFYITKRSLLQASELTTFPILQGGNTRCVTTH
jgi:hypothetical protein